jgi:Holliday junction resolvasome RuvABC endonuclease subunit
MANAKSPNKKTPVKILAFDPAAGNTGWALAIFAPATRKLTVVKTGIINGDKAMRALTKDMLPEFSKQYTVLQAIRITVSDLIKELSPDAVVSEAPFAHRFPAAFASLTLVVDRIRTATRLIIGRNISVYPPMEVKKAVSGKGSANKDAMKASVLGHAKIIFPRKTSNTDLSEHEYDAIAVAYTHGIKAC